MTHGAFKVWDIETTTTTSRKRKANPFDPANWVVTHAFSTGGGKPEEHRFGSTRPPAGWFLPVLEGSKLIAGFNIKFDLLYALQDPTNLKAWMKFVAGGGLVWDCQLAEYLLNGMDQQYQMLSLEEVSACYGGTPKIDEVGALWRAGVQTQDIEPALLSRYLAGDIDNTERIARAQIQRARECNQLPSILLNMGALICSTEMERNGMHVDVARGYELAAQLRVRIGELETDLRACLPDNLPFQFNWGSWKQKSAFIFGGVVPYDSYEYDLADGGTIMVDDYMASDPKPALKYASREVTMASHTLADGTVEAREYDPALPLHWVLRATGKNAGEVVTKKVKIPNLDKPKGRTKTALFTFPRTTVPKKSWTSSTPGYWSVDSDTMAELSTRGIKFVDSLLAYTGAVKDLGTYYITTDADGTEKGMLSLVDDSGLIHHSINHCMTVTGRLSASSPNLQNVPRGDKSDVKSVFVSRFGDTGKIIQSDFSALEIYMQAILTGCTQLMADLRQGLDMHVLRLSQTEGLPYEEVLLLCKGDAKAGIEPNKEWQYKRTDSKGFSFKAAYGAGDTSIAATTGMSEERVAALRAADNARYPEIEQYFEKRTTEIKTNRRPTGVTVPHPEVPGLICHLGRSTVRTPDRKLYAYMESPSPEFLAKKGIPSSFSPTIIKNYEVQGSGGEWAKAAMWLAVRAFYEKGNFGGRALLVNQVHDALYVDSAPEVLLESAALLTACMQSSNEFMERHFNWAVPVQVPCETKAGANMMEEKDIPGVAELAARIRAEIRSEYINGHTPTFEGE
jgi:DNA polymerase I